MRDVKSLTGLLKEAKENNLDIGSNFFCRHYNDKCYYDAYRLFEITDKLDWIFKKDQLHFKLLKRLGLRLINNNGNIKEKIVKFAMGFN